MNLRLSSEGTFLGSTCSSGWPKNYFRSEDALIISSSPILPAFKSATSGCPIEVGPVGLAFTKTHMGVLPGAILLQELRTWLVMRPRRLAYLMFAGVHRRSDCFRLWSLYSRSHHQF
jgi:hypothetical protein